MSKERPEDNYEPSADDLRKAEELLKRLTENDAFEDGGKIDAAELQRELASSELSRRRFDIEEKIFQASDLVEATSDLPYRQAVRRLLSATCMLLDPVRKNEERRVMFAVQACRDALRELRGDD